MTEVAQTYLGNINHNLELAKSIPIESCLKVHLTSSDRTKGRIYSQTDTGLSVGIIKDRDRSLQSGDVFQTRSKKLLLIHLQSPEFLVLDFSATKTNYLATQLVNLGHILGNHHCPIAIKDHKVYVQLSSNSQVIEKAIKDLQITELKMYYETSNIVPKNLNSHPTH